jgi:hypothetical protein
VPLEGLLICGIEVAAIRVAFLKLVDSLGIACVKRRDCAKFPVAKGRQHSWMEEMKIKV